MFSVTEIGSSSLVMSASSRDVGSSFFEGWSDPNRPELNGKNTAEIEAPREPVPL
jgi:hypothetical protein